LRTYSRPTLSLTDQRERPGADEPLVWYEGSGTSDRRWLHADERGSIVAVSDNSGSAIAINRYDEYGKPASTNLGRFQYTGQAWLPEIGLYNYKARMYHPALGRFMPTDPIGYDDGMNWYNYGGGDPIDETDPEGLNRYNPAQRRIDPVPPCDDEPTVTAVRPLMPMIRTVNVGWSPGNRAPGFPQPKCGAPLKCATNDKPKPKPKPQKPFTCANATAESGRIKTSTLSVSGVLGLGMVGATGT
jgi:RHS repeat-associated protein